MTRALNFFIVGTLMMLWGLYDGFQVLLAIDENSQTNAVLKTMVFPFIKFLAGIALFSLARDAVITFKKEQEDSSKK